MKTQIEVEIKHIDVDDRYYSFDFVIKVDGKVEMEDNYESDYENGMSREEWKKFLEDGYAVKEALIQYSED